MNSQEFVKRFDLGEITDVERTPQGFLKVPAFVTRCGVFPYIGKDGTVRKELRHPDDVFDPVSIETLKNAVVTNEHPPVMIDPKNFDEYAVGYSTGRVEVNREMLETDLIIANAKAIEAVDNGKRETSAGYLAQVIEEAGNYNGADYTHRQKNIRYNHIAIVDRGRAGPEVRMRLDSADAVMQDVELMKRTDADGESKKIVISGQEVELPAHQADVIQALLDRYDEMRGKLMDLEGQMKKDNEKKDVDVSQKGISSKPDVQQMAADGRDASKKIAESDTSGVPKAKGDEDADGDNDGDKKKDEGDEKGVSMSPAEKMMKDFEDLKKSHSDLMAKHDALQAKCDEMAAKTMDPAVGPGKSQTVGADGKMDSARELIRARVRLERQAAQHLAEEMVEKFDSMSEEEVMGAVIKKYRPSADLRGKSAVYIQSRFDSIIEEFGQGEKVRREMGSMMNRMDAEQTDPAAARKQAMAEAKDLWKQPLSANKK